MAAGSIISGGAMRLSQKLAVELSELRQKLNAFLTGERELTEEQRAEFKAAGDRYSAAETEYQTALVAEAAEDEKAQAEFNAEAGLDAETAELRSLRGRCTFTAYCMAALTGRQLAGAEAELAAHFDCGQNEVPLELFEGERHEFADAPTPAPATVTTALRPITPAIFARSLAPRLGIAMPRAAGGTFTEARVSTNLTAAAKGKGDDTDSTAAAITVQTSTVKRVSARMSVRQEDVIAIGLAGFESALRMNLEAVLSDALDDQIVQGDGTGDNLSGLLSLLANPADPTSVPDWEDWAEQQAALVDGLWATTLKEVAMLVGPATYRKAAATFSKAPPTRAN